MDADRDPRVLDESDGARAASPIIGNLLLVAVVIVVGIVVTTLAFTFLDRTGAPTAEASFEYEQTPAGVEMTPVALGTDVVVLLNGEQITTFDADSTGTQKLIPTAPGDDITVVSRDEDRSVLVEKTVDDRSEVGDFIAYYTFDGGGTTLEDRSGNGNDGTLESDGGSKPTWGGCGLSFDGADDHVLVDDISAPVDVSEFTIAVTYVQRGPGSGSISQLVEHTWSGNEWFLENRDSAGGDPYRLEYAVEFPRNVLESGYSYDYGERHTVVGTYDGSTYELYVDGTRVGSASSSRAVDMGDMRFGRDFESTSQYFDGEMCEARLYYTAFDASEIGLLTTVMD